MLQNPKWKKLIFTGGSIPLLYKTIWAWKWQAERKKWKQGLIDERVEKLSSEPAIIN